MGNSGSSIRVQAPKNPLLISLILSDVFSHVEGVEDLKNIRLVCRLWWEMSLDKWRNLVTLRLSLSQRRSNNVSCKCCPPKASQTGPRGVALDVELFLQLVQNSLEQGDSCPVQLATKPFRHYRIENCYLSLLRYSDDDEVDELKRLLRVCGPHMKYLDLDHCILFNDRYAQFFQRILSKELINLEELSVLFVSVARWERSARVEHVSGTEHKPKALTIPVLKKLTVIRCENQGQMVMPVEEEWREFFHYIPNLKDLTVDAGTLCSVFELEHPSITGQPIRLSSLSYTHKGRTLLSRICTGEGWTLLER